MSFCQQELWWETTPSWLSRSQTRSFCLPEPSPVISALSKSRTKCLFSLNPFALKASRISKQLLTTRFALVVEMVKWSFSTLTKTSANLWCNANYTEVFKAFALLKMVYRCWLPQARVSFTDLEWVISLKCCWPRTTQSLLFTLTIWQEYLTSFWLPLWMEPSDFGMPMTTLWKLDVSMLAEQAQMSTQSVHFSQMKLSYQDGLTTKLELSEWIIINFFGK